MKKIIGKFIPRSLKNSIKEFINSQIDQNKINKIDTLSDIVYDLYPPLIIVNEKIEAVISDFIKKYKVSDKLNYNISKNDFMYLYLLLFCNSNPRKAYWDYLESGLNSYNVIKKIGDAKFGKLENVESFLDFASGHGRMERFLVLNFPPEKIWVSDVKESSNEFQREQFGVNSIPSTFSPEQYNPGRKFDIIFVGSLFSHLPEELFEKWLRKLYDITSDNGVLIVSTHDISIYSSKGEEFIYLDNSEDSRLNNVNESIENRNVYGSTFISESKFNKILSKISIDINQSKRYHRALWGFQDIYLLTKTKTPFTDSLNFSTFP